MVFPARATAHRRALVASVAAILAATIASPVRCESLLRGVDPRVPLADLHLARWTTSDGLPSDTLLDVHQASTGQLWVAGFGGLARFDGIGFEVFNQKRVPDLAASSFYQVVEHEGTLWIASQDSGIWRFRDNRFSPVDVEQARDSVRSLLFDDSGTLWAGLADRGAMRLEGGKLVPTGQPALEGVTVRDILQSEDGALWFATEGEGLKRLAGGQVESITTAHGLADDSVTNLWQGADGSLWVGTQAGVSRVRDGVVTTFAEFADVEVFHLAGDDHGSVWVAAEQGLYRRAAGTGRVERLAAYGATSLRSVNGLVFDHEGGVWVSSYTSGLFLLRESRFANWTRAEGLTTDRVNSVYQRRDGSLLIGGDLGVVQVLQDGELSRLGPSRLLPDVRVRGFLEDRAGTLWVSSYAGVLRVGAGPPELLTVEDGLPTNRARFVYEDRTGRLWVGTRDAGLVEMMADGRFEAMDSDDGLASDFVLSLAEDRKGRLLVGTQDGLSVVELDGSVRNYGLQDGLPGRLVFNVHPDDDGAIWLATTGGLARLLDDRVEVVTVRQGLPTEAVYDFAEDDRGDLWTTTSRGVVRIEKSQLEELLADRRATIEPRLFDRADGMADHQCTGATRMAKAADGSLWVPTLGGLSRLDPRRVRTNPVAPPVHISRVDIDGETVAGPYGSEIPTEAPPGSKNFEFRFSALSFQAPARVEVSYQMEGFDDDWIVAGSRRRAVYTGLPPGDFVFRVIAANQDGVWNREGASFALRVLPRYYQTAAFLLLVALALAGGPWAVYRWRLRTVQRRSAELMRALSEQRRLEAERLRLIEELELRNDQLENLTHAVSHDLKSPLFTIQGFTGVLERDLAAGGDKARVDRDLARIREAATYMGRLLEQLSRVRRIERTEAHLEEVDLGELAREVVAAVAGVIGKKQIRVSVSPDMPPILGDRLQLTEMLQNLVDNAARFMGDQPEPRIDVGWRLDGDETVFYVRDNGMGLEPRFHKVVFKLFQRLNANQEGTGVGLTIVKRVVEAHRGRVWVESEGAGKGTTFCFTLRGSPPTPRGDGSATP